MRSAYDVVCLTTAQKSSNREGEVGLVGAERDVGLLPSLHHMRLNPHELAMRKEKQTKKKKNWHKQDFSLSHFKIEMNGEPTPYTVVLRLPTIILTHPQRWIMYVEKRGRGKDEEHSKNKRKTFNKPSWLIPSAHSIFYYQKPMDMDRRPLVDVAIAKTVVKYLLLNRNFRLIIPVQNYSGPKST